MRAAIVLLGVLLVAESRGAPNPYDAIDDAAAAALWRLAAEQNSRREHIGLLYGTAAGIERTPTRDTGGTRNAGGTFAIPPGSLRGLFHNHPQRELARGAHGAQDEERAQFSGDDIRQARALGVPSYISAGDKVLRYDPSTGKAEEVLAQIPLDEIRRLYLADGLKR